MVVFWKKRLLVGLALLLLLGGIKGWRFLRLVQLTHTGKTKLENGDFAGVLAIAQKLQLAYPGDPHGFILESWLRHRQRLYPEALKLINHALEKSPNEPEFHYVKGIILIASDRYEEAAEACGRAAAFDTKSFKAVQCRGRAYYLNGQHSLGQQDAEKLIAQDAKDFRGYLLRGDLALFLRYPEKALTDYQQVSALEPKKTIGFTRQGSAFLEMRQPALALGAFDKAIALDPRDAIAWKGRGVAHHDLKDYREAIKSYQQAAALDAGLEGVSSLMENARKWTQAQAKDSSSRCGMGRCGE